MTTTATIGNGAVYVGNEARSQHYITNTDVLDAFSRCVFPSRSEFNHWMARFRNVGTPMSRMVLIREMKRLHAAH